MPPGRKTGSQRTTLGRQGTTSSTGSGSTAAVALTVVYHPNLERIGDRAILEGLSFSRAVSLSRTELAFSPPGRADGEPLLDENMSRTPIHFFESADGGVRIELGGDRPKVHAFCRGEHKGRMFTAEQVQRGVVLDINHRVVLLLHTVTMLGDILGAADAFRVGRGLIGESESWLRVLYEISSVADMEVPVLLRGETGTGKEVVARAIHEASPRRKKAFHPVNSCAVPASLLASELFGAEKGSYTGSQKDQDGYFERARGGTLFFDEIGDTPVEFQRMLLRALENGEIQTVGAQQIRRSDVRIITATDANLETRIAEGTFSAPLLARISRFDVRLPPLRDRRDDIGRFLIRFLREELNKIGEPHRLTPPFPKDKPWLSSSTVALLADYDWPLNVRQLQNIIGKIVMANRGQQHAKMPDAVKRELGVNVVAHAQRLAAPPPPGPAPAPFKKAEAPPAAKAPTTAASHPRRPSKPSHASITEEKLTQALDESDWTYADAAKRLGIGRSSIYNHIKRFERLRRVDLLTAEEIVRSYQKHGGDTALMAEDLGVPEQALIRRMRRLNLK